MKTLEQWVEEFRRAQQDDLRVEFIVNGIRQEAFDRCELEAYRADTWGLVELGAGKILAERIAKVFREEGAK